MIVGDPASFAIESHITQAYGRLGLRALGYFVIHVAGQRYGVDAPDATLLACSFGEVESRIAARGSHTAPFAEMDARGIAAAFRGAIYGEVQEKSYFGLPATEFVSLIDANCIMWAPDGDAAFDDGSYVLQFDVGGGVRLIAFKSGHAEGDLYDPATLNDIRIGADDFYRVLQSWRDAFESEWASMPKDEAGRGQVS